MKRNDTFLQWCFFLQNAMISICGQFGFHNVFSPSSSSDIKNWNILLVKICFWRNKILKISFVYNKKETVEALKALKVLTKIEFVLI